MSNLSQKFMKRIFRRVAGLAWDLSSGSVGVKNEAGIFTFALNEAGDDGQVTVNPFDSFSLAIPAFAMQTPATEVKSGDLLVGDTAVIGWVIGANEAGTSFKIHDHNGHTKNYTPPKVAIIGNGGLTVMVVRHLFALTGGADGAQGLMGMLPLLAMNKSDAELEKLFPLFLMGNLGGTTAPAVAGAPAAAANPMAAMLPLLLLSKGGSGGDIDPMMLMAMSGGLGGNAAGGMSSMLPLLLLSKGKDGGTGDIDPMLLMAMSGGLGGGAAGGVNPLLMMTLLGKGGGDVFGGNGVFGDEGPTVLPLKLSKPSLQRTA